MTTPEPPPQPDPQHIRAQRNEAILLHMQVGLVVYRLENPEDDSSLIMEDINPAAQELLGLLPEHALGRRVVDLLPAMAWSPRLGAYADIARGGPARDFGNVTYGDNRLARADYAVKAFPLSGLRLGMLFENVTEQVAARQLKSEFVGMVSHELRTPLTSIRGAIGLLASGKLADLPTQAKDLLAIASKNCDRLSRLINDLLDLEKVEAGKLNFTQVEIEAREALENVQTELSTYAQDAGVELEVDSEEGSLFLLADPDRLQQLLVNLVSNAVKFSPRGAAVTLRASRQGQHLRFEVVDRGPGIPEAFKYRIFQKFSQSDLGMAKGGSGLGLSLAKSFAERMGGTLGFESEEGRGSCFYSTFPLHRNAPAKGAQVLIVEDDPDVAHLLALLLTQEGITSDWAGSMPEARKRLAEPHAYRALTLDLLLPGGNGLDLLREIRENPNTQDLPVVVVSARAKEGREELEGMALGVLDWLEKPIDLPRLRRLVLQAVGRGGTDQRPILHIEDDPDLREIVASCLAGLAPLAQAGSLFQARLWLKTQIPSVVLLDLRLPDGNGLDLLPELSGQPWTAPIVIFSALELPKEYLGRVHASLVKARDSEGELRETLLRLLKPAG